MGEVIEKIVIRCPPSKSELSDPLEITVKGTDNDMMEFGAKVISALREKGLFPDTQIVPSRALRNAISSSH